MDTEFALPIIDFSKNNVEPGTDSWVSTRKKVIEALEELGCFVLLSDNVSAELSNAVFLQVDELFAVPTGPPPRTVSEIYESSQTANLSSECFGISSAESAEAVHDFAHPKWPSESERDKFCETLNSYIKQALELENMVTKMVFEGYNVEKYCDSHLKTTTHRLHMIKYKLKVDESGYSGAHTDPSFLAIIHQNGVQGLEVRTKDGKWIPVHLPPSSFAVIAGDALKAWSNGRIRAPLHRVLITAKAQRYSMVLFEFQTGIVEAPKELINDESPLRFRPFNNMEYCVYVGSNKTNILREDKLQAYAGI